MNYFRKVSARVFVDHIHTRCKIGSVYNNNHLSAPVLWNDLLESDYNATQITEPFKIRDVDDEIVECFSGWNSRALLSGSRCAEIPVRSTASVASGPTTFGNSQTSGYMGDVYKEYRSLCQIDEFVNWLETDSNSTRAMYLAGVSLTSITGRVPYFKLPRSITQHLIPDSPLIYMGKGRQRTPLHFDPTGNLVVAVRGQKKFDLFPPSSSKYLNPIGGVTEAFLSWYGGWVPSVYSRYRGDEPILADIPGRIRIELKAGEALWMPPCWWHGVSGGEAPNVILVYGTRPV